MDESRKKAVSGRAHDDDTAQSSTQSGPVSNDDVAQRAYTLYLARGCEPGKDVEDWLQAEQELRSVATPTEAVPSSRR
jgi:DUF2934 family protein